MRRSVRNGLLLIGCLLVIVAAGGFALFALNGASAAGAQVVTASLRVVQNDPGGIAKLSTVTPTTLGAGQVVPAGTAVTVSGVSLTSSMAPAPAPAIGATLRCSLSVSWSVKSQVIDIVKCAPATVAASTP
jgi:hypothetical protein